MEFQSETRKNPHAKPFLNRGFFHRRHFVRGHLENAVWISIQRGSASGDGGRSCRGDHLLAQE